MNDMVMKPAGGPRELYSLEAEQSVIGALLLDNAAFDRIVGTLTPQQFGSGDHQRIFNAIVSLITEHRQADVITVLERLKSRGELWTEQGQSPLDYLQQLVAGTPSVAGVAHYADIVRERWLMRRFKQAVMSLEDMVDTANGLTAAQMIDAAQADMLGLTSATTDRLAARHVSEFIDLAVEEVDAASKKAKSGGISGLETGFLDLDQMLNGIGDSDLVVVGGRPSHGKTAFALNVCEHLSAQMNRPTAFFSLEMTNVQLTKRLLASQSGVHGIRLKDGRLTDDDWSRFAEASARMRKAPFFFSDANRLTAAEVSAQARKLKRDTEGNLALIVIDYLGLMDHGDAENRAASIERTTNALKALAKELMTPVMLLSQVNRGCESRPNKRPIMSDLRESGGVEQDADTIMFVYRHFVYHPDQPELKHDAEIIVAKQRSGPIGTANLYFDSSRTRFKNGVSPSAASSAQNSGNYAQSRGE